MQARKWSQNVKTSLNKLWTRLLHLLLTSDFWIISSIYISRSFALSSYYCQVYRSWATFSLHTLVHFDFDATYSQRRFSFDSDESDGTSTPAPAPVPATAPAKLAICQIKFTTAARAEHLNYRQHMELLKGAEGNSVNCVSNKTFCLLSFDMRWSWVSCELSCVWPRSAPVRSILNA